MSNMPSFLRFWLSRIIFNAPARAILDYLDSNSVWVIVDDIRKALGERRSR